jgi:hypothetical protein
LEYTDSTVKNFKKAYDSVWEGSIVQYPQWVWYTNEISQAD